MKIRIPANSIVIEGAWSADLSDLEPAPIRPALAGTPAARSKILARSRDRTSCIMVWECTAGRFNWDYCVDETVVIISGEVFISTEEGEERRLGQGDMGFFPAGSSCVWHVKDHIKKIAFLRHDLPPLLGLGVKCWHKLLDIVGLRGQSSLMPALLAALPLVGLEVIT
jgi:uncharacterized cupin superfamily protein